MVGSIILTLTLVSASLMTVSAGLPPTDNPSKKLMMGMKPTMTTPQLIMAIKDEPKIATLELSDPIMTIGGPNGRPVLTGAKNPPMMATMDLKPESPGVIEIDKPADLHTIMNFSPVLAASAVKNPVMDQVVSSTTEFNYPDILENETLPPGIYETNEEWIDSDEVGDLPVNGPKPPAPKGKGEGKGKGKNHEEKKKGNGKGKQPSTTPVPITKKLGKQGKTPKAEPTKKGAKAPTNKPTKTKNNHGPTPPKKISTNGIVKQ